MKVSNLIWGASEVSRFQEKQVVFHRVWRTSSGMRCIYHGVAASRKLEVNIYRSQLRQVHTCWKRGEPKGKGGLCKLGGVEKRGRVRKRQEEDWSERKTKRTASIFPQQSKQTVSFSSWNPSASPHCSSLWCATKEGDARREEKREWANRTNFAFLTFECSHSLHVVEGPGLVSLRAKYESIRVLEKKATVSTWNCSRREKIAWNAILDAEIFWISFRAISFLFCQCLHIFIYFQIQTNTCNLNERMFYFLNAIIIACTSFLIFCIFLHSFISIYISMYLQLS